MDMDYVFLIGATLVGIFLVMLPMYLIYRRGIAIYISVIMLSNVIVAAWLGFFLGKEGITLVKTSIAMAIMVPILIFSFRTLAKKITIPAKQVAAVAASIAEGNLEQCLEVNSNDEFGDMANALNEMNERIHGVLNEMNGLIQAVQEGRLNVRGNANAFAGGWRELVVGMNNVIDAFVTPITMTAEHLDRIAKGDIPDPITDDYQGDFNEIKTNLNTLIETMRGLLQETNGLIQAIQAGRLNLRGNAQTFAGGWHDLIQGINTVVDAFVAPITMAAQSIDRIAQGEIPDPITDAYQGDFNTIKDNLNSLIAATHDITGLAEALAAGNLEVEVQERSDQDTLMQALNTMIQRLREVVRHVKSATKNVAIGSSELIFSAKQMSEGASEQAAATEEASSSLEEMAANIKQNAENAIQTEQMARRTADDAEEGGQAVTQTVVAMKEIVEKILIIQEIAQETRMLSLNATIEAARASEHGRAFSTVAAEIRQLANTTKKSAETIKHLSDSSVAIAERSGTMLAKMVPNSQKTAELVQEISAASNEQSMGVNQVNKAIYQLDQVTQQNASLAEQVAAMAEKLADQSIHLQSAVEFFTLAETALPEEKEAARSETPPVEPGGRKIRREQPTRPERIFHHAVGRNNLKQDRTSPRHPQMQQMERDNVEEQDDVNDPHDAEFERY